MTIPDDAAAMDLAPSHAAAQPKPQSAQNAQAKPGSGTPEVEVVHTARDASGVLEHIAELTGSIAGHCAAAGCAVGHRLAAGTGGIAEEASSLRHSAVEGAASAYTATADRLAGARSASAEHLEEAQSIVNAAAGHLSEATAHVTESLAETRDKTTERAHQVRGAPADAAGVLTEHVDDVGPTLLGRMAIFREKVSEEFQKTRKDWATANKPVPAHPEVPLEASSNAPTSTAPTTAPHRSLISHVFGILAGAIGVVVAVVLAPIRALKLTSADAVTHAGAPTEAEAASSEPRASTE